MPPPPSLLHLSAGVVDLARREIAREGDNVSLSTREVELLAYLAAREGEVVSRAELLTEVWGYKATVETRAVDVTMRRLREKVEVDPAAPDHLLTRHGDGYSFVAHAHAPAPPPAGPEVAFVFTDIQGSTAQWERLGSAYQAVIDHHAILVRATAAAHRGYEVKTAGDGFMLAFATAGQALAAAVGVQEALATADFGEHDAPVVRVGVHVGPATGRADPVTGRVDWFGPTVNRAARLMASAHGGQVVVTDAVRMSAPVDVAWTNLGEHAFPGIAGTTRVWQALPHSLAQRRFPALLSIPRARLPAPADPFVGRVDELAEIEARFAEGARLVTLLGPGGTGKTRLALEHARTCDAPSVWFCNLVEAQDESAVCRAMGDCMGQPLGEDPAAQIAAVLAHHGEGRVVIDNAEQVAEGLGRLLRRWMSAARDTTFLVTSRLALRVPGEQVLATGPLAEGDAVRLFVDRARAAGATVEPDDPDVLALVVALDAWPLSLELAAARTRAVAVGGLLRRLGQRFQLLVGGSGESRHGALHEVLHASWEALEPGEQDALAQLSVFVGGFTLEAAEAVIDGDSIGLLSALADNALVRLDQEEGRYSMLVTIRDFAAAMLRGEARAETERRHGGYFAALGAAATASDIPNLVAASTSATARGEGDVAAACAVTAAGLLEVRGPFADGVAVVLPAMRVAPPQWQAELSLRAGVLLCLSGQVDASLPHLQDAANHEATAAAAGVALGRLERERGRGAEAVERLRRAAALAADRGEAKVECAAYANLGDVYVQVGQPDDARAAMARALDLARAAGDPHAVARVYTGLSLLHGWYSHPREALPVFAAAKASQVGAHDRTFDATVHMNWALFSMEHGWLEEAEAAGQVALSLHRSTGRKRGAGVALAVLGYIAVVDGRLGDARERLEEAVALQREVKDARIECHALGFTGLLELAEGQPARAVAVLDAATGLARSCRDRMLLATTLGFLGQAHLDGGDAQAAGRAVDEALDGMPAGGRPYARAWLWVVKAGHARAVGDADGLARALAGAQALVDAVEIGARSDVGRRLSALRTDPV